jgi:hypothetical protein
MGKPKLGGRMRQAEQNETNNRLTMLSAKPAGILLLATRLAELMAWARAMSLKQPLTETQADVHMQEWALIAEEVGFDALARAVKEVMRNDSDWFPSVRAIRQRAGLNREEQFAVDADEAWEESSVTCDCGASTVFHFGGTDGPNIRHDCRHDWNTPSGASAGCGRSIRLRQPRCHLCGRILRKRIGSPRWRRCGFSN